MNEGFNWKMHGPSGEGHETELRFASNSSEEPCLDGRVVSDGQDKRAFYINSGYDWMNHFPAFSTTDW